MTCSHIPDSEELHDVKFGVWCAMTAERITALILRDHTFTPICYSYSTLYFQHTSH